MMLTEPAMPVDTSIQYSINKKMRKELVFKQEVKWICYLLGVAFQMIAHCFPSFASGQENITNRHIIRFCFLSQQGDYLPLSLCVSHPSCMESVSLLSWPKDIVRVGIINWWRRLDRKILSADLSNNTQSNQY